MSMFGWNDSGGGTILPRRTALELQARGHEVQVFYAAVPPLPGQPPYTVQAHQDQHVQLWGLHNRPAYFLDAQHPWREVFDPEVVMRFQRVFEQFQPDIVHYHNFLGLSLGIADVAAAAGVPSFYTPYNFWLLCPTLYLSLPNLVNCQGVNATGSNCLGCTQAVLPGEEYLKRRDRLRENYQAKIGTCLASSHATAQLLLANGYAPEKIEILKFGNDRAVQLWNQIGQQRPAAVNPVIQIAYMGSVISLKGVHILVAAAQLLKGEFEVHVYGEGPADYLQHLKSLDRAQKVQFHGRFENHQQAELLSGLDLAVVSSICYDQSPLVISEFQAARVPVIGAQIGGIPDYIQAGAGRLYDAQDPRALAQILQDLLDHPEQIVTMQSRIQAPQTFADYLGSLEQRYTQATVQAAVQIEARQQVAFLQQDEPMLWVQPQTLRAIAPASQPYALNLTHPSELKCLTPTLMQQAQWIRVIDQQTQKWVQQQAPDLPCEVVWPSWQTELPRSLEALSEAGFQFLMPLDPAQNAWKPALQAYLQHQADPRLSCILVAWNSEQEQAQEALLAFLEAEGFDLEQIPELLLLEQPSAAEWRQMLVMTQLVVCVLEQASFAQLDLQYAQGLLLPSSSAASAAFLASAPPLQPLVLPETEQVWLKPFVDWQALQLALTPAAYSAQQKQQLQLLLGRQSN